MGSLFDSIFARCFAASASQHVSALANENQPLRENFEELKQKFLEGRKNCLMPPPTVWEMEEDLEQSQEIIQESEERVDS